MPSYEIQVTEESKVDQLLHGIWAKNHRISSPCSTLWATWAPNKKS